ncbi:MAG TPA: hypothetical protein VFQ50_04775 [Flavobacterium sp.]|jgi:hypothetical protein|nr:hypothetical protein [Flavobacterium sp.]
MKVRFFPNEQFKEIVMEHQDKLKFRYAVSNKGRLVSFSDQIENGRLLRGCRIDGYAAFHYKIRLDGVLHHKSFFMFKKVAEYFIPRTSDDQKYVIHLDYVRDHDDIRNLKWATYDEMIAHGKRSPHVIQAKKNLLEFNIKSDGRKLTATKVILIKKLLSNPNRTTRLKMIAKQFGVSETHIKRIASGENWGHIKI